MPAMLIPVNTYYSDAMAQAYKSNFEQQNNIVGAGLNIGATKELMGANRQDLMNTYDNYIKNYGSTMQSVDKAYSEETTAINEALTERATNFSNLYNSAYDYLTNELYGSTTMNNGISTDYMQDLGLDWLVKRDANGNALGTYSWDEIKNKLFDSDGSLNAEGTKFFDQMFNANTLVVIPGQMVLILGILRDLQNG